MVQPESVVPLELPINFWPRKFVCDTQIWPVQFFQTIYYLSHVFQTLD